MALSCGVGCRGIYLTGNERGAVSRRAVGDSVIPALEGLDDQGISPLSIT